MWILRAFIAWLTALWRWLVPLAPVPEEQPAPMHAVSYRDTVPYGSVRWVESQAEAAPWLADENAIVIVKGTTGPKWLMMNCPDHCGEIGQISLSQATPPTWRFRIEEDGTVSLYPSVWLTSGCGVHFILRHSKALVV
ncbi:DUF6527 family protein [Bradyrhizobium genosp. P]|uniref:DUF6527 family protein n=1 Tax=Bradyrhizobium genosp. P TaxID=83641 RepID=UPI003CF3BBCE